MKNFITIIGLLLAAAANAQTGTFNMVQINPNAGYCDDLFTDSNKYVYGAGDLKHFAKLNGLLYFVANDAAYNDELWVTDGTQSGTHLVKEINPNGGAHIGDLRVLNNKLMFLANETTTDLVPTDDFDLFVSDGTSAGTVKVNELNQPFNTLLGEQNAGIANGKVVFCTNTDVMVSDGTNNGTKSLAAINIVSYQGANGYCDMNGNVYFIVNSDIWKSDGTIAGTKAVKSVANSSNPWPLAYANTIKAFDGKLYIIGAKSGEGDELYTFDGTENGAVTKVISYPGTSGNCYPGSLDVCGGSLWFTAYDTLGSGIYRLTSSAAAPQRMGAALSGITFGNGKVYFPNAMNNGYNVIDAMTGVQTSFSKSNLTLGFSTTYKSVLVMGDKVIYLAYDSASGQQVMCITDGTSAGIKVVMPAGTTVAHPFDYIVGCGTVDIFDLTYYDNKIVIPGDFNNAGRELWFYEEAGLVNGIKDVEESLALSIYPNPASSKITIELTEETATSVQLFDISGKAMTEQKMTGNKVTVNTSNLSDGAYVVAVKNGDETIARRKLIVAH